MSMDKKKRSTASNSLGYLVLVIGIVIAVNLIGTRVFKRIDLTDAKVYTLSPASKDIVKKLPDILTVNAYISDSLPPELKSLSRYVRDLLDEYASSSGGKLHFQSVDPGLGQEAGGAGHELRRAEDPGPEAAKTRSSRSAPTTWACASTTARSTKRCRRSSVPRVWSTRCRRSSSA